MPKYLLSTELVAETEDESPADGEIVVALLQERKEATIKRQRRAGEKVRLVPENSEHEEMVLAGEDVTMQDRGVAVIHEPHRGR